MKVRFAVPPVEPGSPSAPKKKPNIVIGGVLALMVGVLGAFGINYLGSPGRGKECQKSRHDFPQAAS